MTQFKGTKGKWVFDDEQIFSLNKSEDTPEVFIATNPHPYSETRETEWMPNALLISKAPEMVDEIEETVTDLKILRNQIINEVNNGNHRFEGMPELMEKWIERKEQLIKEATEL